MKIPLKKYKIVLLILAINSFSFAQKDSIKLKETKLEEVLVYANPSPKALSDLARVVTVVSQKELATSTANSLYGILNGVGTVDIQNRGTAQADISLRGGSFDQTLLMLNGIAINDPQTGHMNLNLMFDKDDVKQIEVLKGSGSKMFGSNAFSGAINFVIDPKKDNELKFKAGVSDFNSYELGFTINNSYKGWQNYLSVLKKQSDGFIYNTATDSKNLFFMSSGSLGKVKLSFIYGLNDNDFGANSFYHWASKEQQEHIRTQLSALKLNFGKKLKNETQFYWKRNYDKYIWKPIYPANLHRTDVYGFKNTLHINEKLSFLIDVKKEKMLSNSMGLALDDVVAVPKEADKYYTKGVTRTNATFSLNYQYNKNNFLLATGVNANYNSAFNWNMATGVELSKKYAHISPYIAINTAYRLPTFFDLYYNSSSNEGNPDLKAEKAITYETGIKYNAAFLSGTASLFARNGRDVIDWARPEANTTAKYRSQNIAQLTTYGAEMNVKIHPKQFWKGSPINYVNFSATLLDQNQNLNGQLSKYAFVFLKSNYNLAINHRVLNRINATWELKYASRSGTYASYETGLIQSFSPYFLMNFQVKYQHKNVAAYMRVANVTNTHYYNTGSLPQASRWAGLGLTYSFKY